MSLAALLRDDYRGEAARSEVLREIVAGLETLLERQKHNRLAYYKPNRKQLEFHAAGATYRERLFKAGNQLGKTWAGAAEAAAHLTGRYPDWWPGRRFDRPTRGWAAGPKGELTRDGPQRQLMGPPQEHGTGYIPADCIAHKTAARGTTDLLDTVTVKHVSGGLSELKFKSYAEGRANWQTETLDWLWFDEEPPPEVYSEGLTRTNVAFGPVWLTFTPLQGMSLVVVRFLKSPSRDRAVITMTIHDVTHYTPEQAAAIIASYPAHERRARALGEPMLGSGAIFPIEEERIKCPPFAVPAQWPCLGGMDFGWDHPFAAVKLAHDRDTDTVYVVNAYRVSEATPTVHVAALLPWGADLPWAWPHDGLQHDKGSGVSLAKQYRADAGAGRPGLRMLPERATFPDGGIGVEAGLIAMLTRMELGRWKVFENLGEWFDEFRNYHRQDGKVVKEMDDLISASRYAAMMLRFARPVGGARLPTQLQAITEDEPRGAWAPGGGTRQTTAEMD